MNAYGKDGERDQKGSYLYPVAQQTAPDLTVVKPQLPNSRGG